MTPRTALVLLALVVPAASSCSGQTPAGPRPLPATSGKPAASGATSATSAASASVEPVPEDVDFVKGVPSAAHWRMLSARPDSEHLANTEVVKILVDRADGQIYFLNTGRFPFHFEFAKKHLSTPERPVGSQAAWNDREYHAPDRRFILGTLAHYVDAGAWAFELTTSDTLDLGVVAQVFEKLRERVFFGKDLRYRPVPAAHERDIARARSLMPVVTTDEIFGKTRYQPLELGESYGYLRVLPSAAAADVAALSPKDIVVLGELPEEVPVVAGVISAELQAPLGHINVLCHNRKTPNMALRGALSDARVARLKDKLVRLVVGGQSFTIEAADEAQAAAFWTSSRPKEVVTPARDDRDVGMPLLTEPRCEEPSLTGAKAAQLARAARGLPKGAVPKAFVLPFYAYARFLKVNGFDKRIDAMLANPAFEKDPAARQGELASLRAAMEKGVVPEDVRSGVMARIKKALPPGALRFRSSTNAEDLSGFNGAGLYRSAKVADPSSEAEVSRALREVWSSVWLSGAFEERRFYGIEHRGVGMAILVQQSVDDIVASGVAITANPWSQGQPGYYINAQVPGGSVTGARGGEVPEQILYYTFEGGRGVERLSKSSKAGGRDVLSAAQVEELAKYLAAIQTTFRGADFSLTGRAMDVEFLVTGAGRVVIVQARPYRVTWSGDRRMSLSLE